MSSEAGGRQKAKELGAPAAEELIAKVPHLARLLSTGQVAQIQKVLDAAVLNPAYEEAYKKAMRASVISRAGDLVLRDRAKERKALRILDKRIIVSKSDACIRVDHNKMLTADALVPRSNNPDEADYLVKVRQTLDFRGVWFRLGQSLRSDPTAWEFWFSLGPDGDTIETDDAIINREELLGTTMLGAGYYRAVWTGHVETKIKRALENFDSAYDDAWSFHVTLMRNRRDAAPTIPQLADLLGGASFPDLAIWDHSRKLRQKSCEANLAGDVIKAQVYLIAAAHAVEYNSQLLEDYLRKTIGGAERALPIVKVIATVASVAEVMLLITGPGVGVKILRAAGSKAMSREVRYEVAEKIVSEYAKKEGISQAELRMVRYVAGPKGTILGGVKGGHSSGIGTGFH